MDFETVEARLIAFIEALSQAQGVLSQYQGSEISKSDIQTALAEKLAIADKDIVDLIHKELTAEKIVELLKSFNFAKYHPEIIAEIELEESILPPGIPKLITEQTVKVKGEIWQVHKNDADPFPSIPYAHNYASGVSLHLGTGDLFKKRASAGQISCKTLESIRGKLTKFTLPELGERCK